MVLLCGASPSQTQPAGGNQECRGSSDEEHGSMDHHLGLHYFIPGGELTSQH